MQVRHRQQAKLGAVALRLWRMHQLAADATLVPGGALTRCAAARALQRSWRAAAARPP